MARTEDGLKVLQPEPVDNERTPLLEEQNGVPSEATNGSLEAQAQQEQREYDAGTVPLAEEPGTGRLLATMSGLWVGTFFAALGML